MIKCLEIEGGAYVLRIPTAYFPKYTSQTQTSAEKIEISKEGGSAFGVESKPENFLTFSYRV